ncbi:MAG: hypothetical protein NC131_01680 [Roseburia sp.]|nr:hypothetical protein [Roseburia sp.]
MAGKIEAYLGFCLKARKISLGGGTVDVLKKGVYLVIVCSTASQNTFELAVKFKNRFSCPLIICKSGLENAVHKAGCKVAAVRSPELAKAIVDNVGGDYELYTER